MNEVILHTKNLTKIYSGKTVVDNVSMTIRKGDIYGLIGKNGAGKTTLIRMVTSLTEQSRGEIELFGEHSAAGLTRARKRIGSVVENPAFYPELSASQNLEYYRILYGIPEKSRIKDALEMVGLTNTGKKKFKNFSLGMKQRLGLALAILGNPDLILLDEPINGLDPIGIIEMRETLQKLNQDYGVTILISSHILSELSQLATCYGIVNNGVLVKEMTNAEVAEECKQCISIVSRDAEKIAAIIETDLSITNYKVIGQNEIRIYDCADDISEINYRLVNRGVKVNEIRQIGDNLEDYFKAIVEGGNVK